MAGRARTARAHRRRGDNSMRLTRWLAVAATVFAGTYAMSPGAYASQGFLTCSSNNYQYSYCNANTQGRVMLLREVSSGNLCRQGRGWGFDNNGIWVDKGCRGEFSFGRDDGGGGGGGGGNWDRPGQVVCESVGYRYRYCNANTQDRVSLVREMSTGNLCRQGYGWGYDSGGIWVDRGCRGEFRYGQDNRRNNDAAIAAGILGAFAIGAAVGSSQNQNPAPPPQPSGSAPSWAVGSFQAWDPDASDHVQLIVYGNGKVTLRHESGAFVNDGYLRDGMVYWNNGKRSWFAREGPGVMVGDVATGKHYYFRRDA